MADVTDYAIDDNTSVTVIRDDKNGMEIEIVRDSLSGQVKVNFSPIGDDD